MTAQYGGDLVLRIGNGAAPEVFTTLGGIRLTHMQVEQQVLSTATPESGSWRTLLSNAGMRSLMVSGEGAFTGSASEDALRVKALSGAVCNWRIEFPDGDMLEGPFMVSSYTRLGDMSREEQYGLTLESAGAITYS